LAKNLTFFCWFDGILCRKLKYDGLVTMFNNDFFELKKALETVTLEVTDLKNQLHKKDLEIETANNKIVQQRGEIQSLNDRIAGLIKERTNLTNSDATYKEKAVDLDIAKNELRIENGRLNNKIIDLTGKIQELKDQIAGLNRENDNLKREAIASKMVSKTFGSVKNFVDKLKNKPDKSDDK